jgi:hypothetical protein
MPSVDELWNVLKPLLEIGVVGAILIIVIRIWLRADRRYEKAMEERIREKEQHRQETVRLHEKHSKEYLELVLKYEASLTSMNTAIQEFLDSDEE